MWKHKRRSKAKTALFVLCSCQLVSGCSLLPEEETRPTLVVQEAEPVDYAVETVKREDIIRTKFIYCTYVQLNDEKLSFQLEGKVVKKVYIMVGDTVKKGDLLAELDLGAAADDMKSLSYNIDKLRIELNSLKRMEQYEKEKEEQLYKIKSITKEQYNSRLKEIEKKYRNQKITLEDDIYIKELELNEYKELEQSSKIYAGMDGIVTIVKDKLEGSVSNLTEEVIRIIDNSNCAFRVETEYAPYFVEGDTVQIEMKLNGGDIYDAKIVHDTEYEEVVYFELSEPNFTLSVGDRGTINLILEQKKDALTVSTKALRRAENFNYVYYINEDGIRSMKEVTVGMTGNNSVEITSGLEVGDIVITR